MLTHKPGKKLGNTSLKAAAMRKKPKSVLVEIYVSYSKSYAESSNLMTGS